MSRSSSSDTRFAASLDAGQAGRLLPSAGRNPHEAAARHLKVDALVCYLDTQAQRAGLDLSTAETAEAMADRFSRASQSIRVDICNAAGVRVASDETWADVVRVYEHRAINLAIEAQVVEMGRVA